MRQGSLRFAEVHSSLPMFVAVRCGSLRSAAIRYGSFRFAQICLSFAQVRSCSLRFANGFLRFSNVLHDSRRFCEILKIPVRFAEVLPEVLPEVEVGFVKIC